MLTRTTAIILVLIAVTVLVVVFRPRYQVKNPHIDLTFFGGIIVNHGIHLHDIYISPTGTIKSRQRSHAITKEELALLAENNPQAIIIGTGQSGAASLTSDANLYLQQSQIEYFIGITPKAMREFNEAVKKKRVAALFHVTC